MLSFLSAGAAEGAGTPAWAMLAYLVSGVFFILALRGLSSPASSRAGNRFGMIGMLIAVVTTLVTHSIANIAEIGIAIFLGGIVGFTIARRIAMTQLPELVAAFHSRVGLAAVLVGAFPLLTSTMLAVAAVVLTDTIPAAKAFSGFANPSVLLVVIAFLVAQAVVKSGLGRRISLFMVGRFGGSSLGLAYSIVLTDAAIAPAFPSNTARGGVLFPIVLSVAQGSGSRPDDPEGRRLGAYLMFCAMASLAVSSALWMTATSANPIGIQVVKEFGIEIGFGKWFLVACVPALAGALRHQFGLAHVQGQVARRRPGHGGRRGHVHRLELGGGRQGQGQQGGGDKGGQGWAHGLAAGLG